MKEESFIQTENTLKLTEEKKEEIKNKILEEWEKADTRMSLTEDLMMGYIFGKFSDNEHYQIEEIRELIEEIWLLKNPPKEISDDVEIKDFYK